jgi:hypothetical protein
MRFLLLILLLSGCSLLPQQNFDSVLYDKYVKSSLVIFNTVAQCKNPEVVTQNVQQALNLLDEALVYEKYKEDAKLTEATVLVENDLTQLLIDYTKTPAPSEAFCRLKLRVQEASLIKILEAYGEKPQ